MNFELPSAEVLAGLSDSDLADLRAAAIAEGAALAAADITSEDADRLEALAAAVDVIDAQIAANEAAAAELAARRDAVAAKFAPAAPAVEDEPAAELAAEEPVADEAVEDESVVAAATAPTGRQIVARAP